MIRCLACKFDQFRTGEDSQRCVRCNAPVAKSVKLTLAEQEAAADARDAEAIAGFLGHVLGGKPKVSQRGKRQK